MIDDLLVASNLDDIWRTVPTIKRLLHKPWPPQDIASALRRLACAGKIEKREDATTAPKFRGSVVKVEFYRRLR